MTCAIHKVDVLTDLFNKTFVEWLKNISWCKLPTSTVWHFSGTASNNTYILYQWEGLEQCHLMKTSTYFRPLVALSWEGGRNSVKSGYESDLLDRQPSLVFMVLLIWMGEWNRSTQESTSPDYHSQDMKTYDIKFRLSSDVEIHLHSFILANQHFIYLFHLYLTR